MLVAIPTKSPGGLDAAISDHFGHCDSFTLVEIDSEGRPGAVKVLPNQGHEQGGCMAPVQLLHGEGVGTLISGGMGGRPLEGFQSVGIKVYFHENTPTVSTALQRLQEGNLREFGAAQSCSSDCSGHDHDAPHAPIQRPPLDGPAEVASDRIVGFNYTLRDGDSGEELDSNRNKPPFHYLHGHQNIIPGLEKAMTGLAQGASATVRIPPEEAYGRPDPKRIIEVPRHAVPADVAPGVMLEMRSKDGHIHPVVVLEITDDKVRLDGNHPFAGKTLEFELTIANIQAAAPEELQAGRALE
jgi:FKBP-type peptidyl-prolyl cis-trans isomerase 2/predicted Fe-Mo cluster-binding NifX family protein